MSDDRFKQARRSLIDRHNQRQQQGGWDDSFDGEDFEDEATAMVNLGDQPAFAPPPNFDGNEPADVRTEMFQIDPNLAGSPPAGGVQMRSHSGVQPSYDSFGGPGGQAPPGAPIVQPQPHPQAQQPTYEPPPTAPAQRIDANQSLVIGDGADFEGKTGFINLNDFAQGGESFTPDSTAAGYEGSTQFVNIAALQASGPPGSTPVEHDEILKQTYQFGIESIQQGEFTLIFAQNQTGDAVVLKRIWEGDPNGMPIPVRQRIAALDQIRHPQLVTLNGMIAAPSGAWVELARPPGFRLSDIINNNGPQDPQQVAQWVAQTAEILSVVHAQAFVYANLNTDAIWIQENGAVILEPFDILSYEQRGNLGVFGPPEMNYPPDQRQLVPATDVYSLAAVTVAALTGLPLNLGAIEQLDKNCKAAVTASLHQDPAQRPRDAGAFVAAMKGKRTATGAGGVNKFKILIPAVFVVGCVGLAAAYFLRPTTPPPPIEGGGEAVVVGSPSTNSAMAQTTTNGSTTGGTTTGTTTGAVVAAAGSPDVQSDPRLQIRTSALTNPASAKGDGPSPDDLDEAEVYREEARALVVDIATLQESSRRERYAEALGKLATAARLSGGMTAADKELFADLSKNSFVTEIRKDYYDRVDKDLKAERISGVKQSYPKLANVDAEAKELKFFVQNKSVDIVTIDPIESDE